MTSPRALLAVEEEVMGQGSNTSLTILQRPCGGGPVQVYTEPIGVVCCGKDHEKTLARIYLDLPKCL